MTRQLHREGILRGSLASAALALPGDAIESVNLVLKVDADMQASRFESDFEGMLTNRRVNLGMLIERLDALVDVTEKILERLEDQQ